MDKARVRDYVFERKPENVPPDALDAALDSNYPEYDWDRGNLPQFARACMQLAWRFVVYAAQAQSRPDTATAPPLPLLQPDILRSDYLAEKIRPAVEQLRRELFGRSAPPFPAYEDAAQWLEHTAAEQEAAAQAKSQMRQALEQTIVEKLEKYQVQTGEGYQVPFLVNLLEYAKPGRDWVHRVHAWGRTSLATLAQTSRTLADATGFSQASVVAYILADIPPLLASLRIGFSSGYSNDFHIFCGSATIVLHSPYVTDAQLREIRKYLRRAWGTEKKRSLTPGHKQLRDIVQRHKGVPQAKGHGEHTTFFEKVRQEYNLWAGKHHYTQHKNWRVTRNAYQRLLKKTWPDGPLAMGFLDGNR